MRSISRASTQTCTSLCCNLCGGLFSARCALVWAHDAGSHSQYTWYTWVHSIVTSCVSTEPSLDGTRKVRGGLCSTDTAVSALSVYAPARKLLRMSLMSRKPASKVPKDSS